MFADFFEYGCAQHSMKIRVFERSHIIYSKDIFNVRSIVLCVKKEMYEGAVVPRLIKVYKLGF